MHDHDVTLKNVYDGPLTITGHIGLPEATWFVGDGESTAQLKAGDVYPLPRTGIICIDTGCGKGGKLTAMVVEDNSFRLVEAPEAAPTEGENEA